MKTKKTKIKNNKIISLALCVGVLLVVAIFIGTNFLTVNATGTAVPLEGYAWSSNIGWISFNCSNDSSCGTIDYKVSADTDTRTLSGYAWSSNIGWIYFGPDDIPGALIADAPGDATGQVWAHYDNEGNFSGWAKALSADGSGGWDGWISMSGDSASSGSYGVKVDSSGDFSGAAWGDDVIGWISFSSIDYEVDTGGTPITEGGYVGLSVDKSSISAGDSVTLTWAPENVSSDDCTASCLAGSCADWTTTVNKSASGGSQTVGPLGEGSHTFALTCTDNDGQLVQDSEEVTATSNFTLNFKEASDSYTVDMNTVVSLEWNAQSLPNTITSCTGICESGSCSSWDGAKSTPNGAEDSDPITEPTHFGLTCTDSIGGTQYEDFTVNLTQGFFVDFPNDPNTDNYITATIIEEDTVSGAAQILVDAAGTFTEPIALSVVSVNGLPTTDFTFNYAGVDQNNDPVVLEGLDIGDVFTIYPNAYSSGVTFTVNIPVGTLDPGVPYAIGIQATGGGYTRTGTVYLNVTHVDRTIIEL